MKIKFSVVVFFFFLLSQDKMKIQEYQYHKHLLRPAKHTCFIQKNVYWYVIYTAYKY